MIDRLPNQVLHPDKQKKLDKEKIELMLKTHDLDENIDLVYELIKTCANGRHIDECVERTVLDFDNKKNNQNKIDAQKI